MFFLPLQAITWILQILRMRMLGSVQYSKGKQGRYQAIVQSGRRGRLSPDYTNVKTEERILAKSIETEMNSGLTRK
jgi:hypothetical protein